MSLLTSIEESPHHLQLHRHRRCCCCRRRQNTQEQTMNFHFLAPFTLLLFTHSIIFPSLSCTPYSPASFPRFSLVVGRRWREGKNQRERERENESESIFYSWSVRSGPCVRNASNWNFLCSIGDIHSSPKSRQRQFLRAVEARTTKRRGKKKIREMQRKENYKNMKSLICTETFSSFAPSHSVLRWPNRNLCTHCNRYLQ